MHKVYKVKQMLCDELEEFGSREKIDAASLDVIDKLAHAIKNIDKILDHEEMKEDGYSNGYPMRGNSYGGRYDEMSYGGGNMNMRRGMRYSDEDRYPNEGMYSRERNRM